MSYFSNKFDNRVIELIVNGGVGFMPSDTIYGLSSSALNRFSVEKIYRLKSRDNHKPCIILLANINQAREVGIRLDSLKPVESYWPASLTFISPAPDAPRYLHRGLQTLAVRIPDNKELRHLLKAVGPLVSTSGNLHGGQPAVSVNEAKKIFGNNLDFYVDTGILTGQPSTVVKSNNGKLEIVRRGAWQIPL